MIHDRQKYLIGGLPPAKADAAVRAAIHKLFLANAVLLIVRHDINRAPMPRPPRGRGFVDAAGRAEGEASTDGRNHVPLSAPSREVVEAARPSHIAVAIGAADNYGTGRIDGQLLVLSESGRCEHTHCMSTGDRHADSQKSRRYKGNRRGKAGGTSRREGTRR
jgi:hypothetical protein